LVRGTSMTSFLRTWTPGCMQVRRFDS
jgi:hypothetical protein